MLYNSHGRYSGYPSHLTCSDKFYANKLNSMCSGNRYDKLCYKLSVDFIGQGSTELHKYCFA